MRLAALIENIPQKTVINYRDIEVSSLRYDSRAVENGSLFVALPGAHSDGHSFIDAAIKNGAVVIVAQYRASDDNSLPVIIVPDTRKALAQLATTFYSDPSATMKLVGITGTDGKTTTTFMTAALLQGAGYHAGLISTVAVKIDEQFFWNETGYTTPEAPEIQETLARMRDAGTQYVALETSSHSLALDRVALCQYDVAVVTNITSDHLDFHGTWEEYFKAKAKLFQMLHQDRKKPGEPVSVLNADDSSFERLSGIVKGRTITYGIKSSADVKALDIVHRRGGSSFTLKTPQGEASIDLSMPGEYNVYNCLAAISVALSQGITLVDIKATTSRGIAVPGRMQRVDKGQSFEVIVDYAHAPNGLRQALSTLRLALSSRDLTTSREPLREPQDSAQDKAKGRVIVVFGCAGERDPGRRDGMGRAAGELADFAILTMDDPRSEDSNDIIQEITVGLKEAGRTEGKDYIRIVDRREAIKHAFSMAQANDIVLLAGMGHERRMLVGNEKLPWNEVEIAGQILEDMK